MSAAGAGQAGQPRAWRTAVVDGQGAFAGYAVEDAALGRVAWLPCREHTLGKVLKEALADGQVRALERRGPARERALRRYGR